MLLRPEETHPPPPPTPSLSPLTLSQSMYVHGRSAQVRKRRWARHPRQYALQTTLAIDVVECDGEGGGRGPTEVPSPAITPVRVKRVCHLGEVKGQSKDTPQHMLQQKRLLTQPKEYEHVQGRRRGRGIQWGMAPQEQHTAQASEHPHQKHVQEHELKSQPARGRSADEDELQLEDLECWLHRRPLPRLNASWCRVPGGVRCIDLTVAKMYMRLAWGLAALPQPSWNLHSRPAVGFAHDHGRTRVPACACAISPPYLSHLYLSHTFAIYTFATIIRYLRAIYLCYAFAIPLLSLIAAPSPYLWPLCVLLRPTASCVRTQAFDKWARHLGCGGGDAWQCLSGALSSRELEEQRAVCERRLLHPGARPPRVNRTLIALVLLRHAVLKGWRASPLLTPGPVVPAMLPRRPDDSALTVSVHVRGGDSCDRIDWQPLTQRTDLRAGVWEGPPGVRGLRHCVHPSVYRQQLERLRAERRVDRVLLATDSVEAMETFRDVPGLTVRVFDRVELAHIPSHLPTASRLLGQAWGHEDATPAAQARAHKDMHKGAAATAPNNLELRYNLSEHVALSALEDLRLLSEGDLLIGGMCGSFSSLAWNLMVARHGRAMPYISLDACTPGFDAWGARQPSFNHQAVLVKRGSAD